MKHLMHLKDSPFQSIKAGTKTIELRLNDEKRQKIKKGDLIEFHNIKDNSKLLVKVIELYHFQSFEDLYQLLPLDKCGYKKEEIPFASPVDMEKYYSKEKQKQYGVLEIEISVITK